MREQFAAAKLGKGETMKTLDYGFRVGDRVQLYSGMDWWMRGARFGEVVGFGFHRIEPSGHRLPMLKVRLDANGRTIRIFRNNLTPV